jgi:ankyrin repeat protein
MRAEAVSRRRFGQGRGLMSRCQRWKTTGLLALLLAAAGQVEAQVVEAVRRGDAEQVRTLLRQGADVNAALGDGMTALHWAAQNGDADLARVLVQAGANVHAGTRIGRYTPLHLAAQRGKADVARVLLDANSRPNAATTNSGATPLHLAASSGDPATISALLERGADVNAREKSWGQTPLTFAAALNRVEAIRLLLQAGADPNAASQSVDSAERERGDQAAERMITQMLAEFKRREGGGANWRPKPSQVQAAIDASREVQLKWPNVDTTAAAAPRADSAAATPIPADSAKPAAADSAKPAAADSARPAASDSAGATPAPAAAGGGTRPRPPAAEEPRALTYAQLVGGWGGLTPLLHAVRQGHKEAVLALLDGGADINQPSEGDQTTPLLMATVNGQHDLGLLLLERGADPNLASAAGTTPLFAVLEREWAPRASYSHPTEHERQQITYMEMLEALLRAGADPDVRLKTHLWYMEYTFSVLGGSGINLQGATPFWRAAYALDVPAMQLLMSYGADPNIPTTKPAGGRRRPGGEDEDKSGLPPIPVGGPAIYPIHAAAGVGYGQSFAGNAHRHVPEAWLAAVKFLVEAGADVNARDANAYTPLHHAASRGDNDVILYLVDRGADVTLLARSGQTTADMANGPIQRVQPFPETIALLEKLGSKNNHKCLSC